MAVPLSGKILLDTNVFINYLRAGQHARWVHGEVLGTVRFLSAVVLLELRLGADSARRARAVDKIHAAFPSSRLLAPPPIAFDQAGKLFRQLHGVGRVDRLAPMNDILIALTARHMGAAVVTSNLDEFHRIRERVSGLVVVSPDAA